MKIKLIFLFIISSQISFSQSVISDTLLQNVRQIRYKNNVATGFFISVFNQDYLVTVKHLFMEDNLNSGQEVEVLANNNSSWIRFKLDIFFHKDPNVDIVVLKVPSSKVNNYYNLLTTQPPLAQDCYFLGYPLIMGISEPRFGGYPIPFVKKGIISALGNDEKGVGTIYVDAHNNQGFSGSPLIIIDNNKKPTIIGVVSGYLNENIQTNNGQIAINSGILLAHHFNYVYEIINRK